MHPGLKKTFLRTPSFQTLSKVNVNSLPKALWCSKRDFNALRTSTSLDTPDWDAV